jgi:hypothetical protein
MKKSNLSFSSLLQLFSHRRTVNRKLFPNTLKNLQIEDRNFPILGNNLTRVEIFNYLWLHLNDSLAEKYLTDEEYVDEGHLAWLTIENLIYDLTMMVAYVATQKKPVGIGASTRNSKGKSDAALHLLEESLKRIESVKISNDLKSLFPDFQDNLFKLKKLNDQLIQTLQSAVTLEKSLLNKTTFAASRFCHIYSWHEGKIISTFSKKTLRLVYNATVKDLKTQGYVPYRAASSFKTVIYDFIDDSLFYDKGEIKRITQNKGKRKEQLHIEENSSPAMRRYQDK